MALHCESMIRNAIGRGMTDTEVLDFAAEGERLARRVKASANTGSAAVEQLTRNYARRKAAAVAGRKRAVELQQARFQAIYNFAMGNFQGMEWEGISALMVGSKYVRAGARESVDSMRNSLTGLYIGSMLNELDALGPATRKTMGKGKLDREIAGAMWKLDDPNYKHTGSPESLAIAKILHKWEERARMDENTAGAWINKIPGYIVRQSHDAAKIKKAGFTQWKQDIKERLDWTRTADGVYDPAARPEDADNFLHEVYLGFITGIHEKFSPTGAKRKDPLANSQTIGSVAARASRQRILHFKTGEDWFDYNALYGRGNLLEGVFQGLSKSANDTALMRIFGPSPQANVDALMKELGQVYRSREDDVSVHKLNNFRKRLDNQMKELDGSLNMEGNPTLAGIGRVTRAVESMSKLGAALVSGFSDIPLMAQEFKYQGVPFFRALGNGLASFIQGRGSLEQRQILSSCGVFFDSMCGAMTSRFTGQELPGKVSALMNTFFKWNGLSLWSDSWKKAATLMMAHDLAQERHLAWQALNPKRQRVLSLYNIDEGKWEMLRKGKMNAADGREYFTPEAADSISKSDLQNYMNAKGMLITDDRVAALREEIAMSLRSYFRDRVQYAILEPDARTQSILHQGQAAGTVTGEALRFVTQFKSFPTVFLQRTLGREIYGYGADTIAAGLKQSVIPKAGELTGLMGMVAMTTLFGYLSMTTKHLLAGKTPRDFSESPEDFGKVLVASMVQGGGLGIIGDFVFGEKSRMGDDFLATLAGPTLGSASSLVSLWKAARDGDDISSTLARTIVAHTPGNNLFWLRPALNHLFLYSVYEMLNPGSTRRLRRRIRKETNQEFFLEPHVWDWAR